MTNLPSSKLITNLTINIIFISFLLPNIPFFLIILYYIRQISYRTQYTHRV